MEKEKTALVSRGGFIRLTQRLKNTLTWTVCNTWTACNLPGREALEALKPGLSGFFKGENKGWIYKFFWLYRLLETAREQF